MRDPNRIPEILQELATYWMNNPDARLGQIVGNAHSLVNPSTADPYYTEDDEILEALKTLNEGSGKRDDNSNSSNSER